MSITLLIILVGLLSIVTYQDFKSRAISWFLIPLLLIAFIIYGLKALGIKEYITFFSLNVFMLFNILIGTTIVISIKEKRLTNIIDSYLGLGDILFFFILTTLFSPINYFIFLIGSIFLFSIIFSINLLINKKRKRLFPLAGAMSALLIITITAQQFISSFNFFQDIIFFID